MMHVMTYQQAVQPASVPRGHGDEAYAYGFMGFVILLVVAFALLTGRNR